jgi:hypothetical protein
VAYSFDGTNKLIVLTPGTVSFDVLDAYSRWKDWVATGDNAKYPQAFRAVGGDPTFGVNIVTPYFFLLNGWRFRPQEASHLLNVDGIVVVDGGGDPFVDTIGNHRVRIQFTVPVRAETVQVDVGGSGVDLGPVHTKLDALAGQITALQTALLDIEGGNWEIVGNQMIFRKVDNTEIFRFNLFDAAGVPTTSNPMKRVRV